MVVGTPRRPRYRCSTAARFQQLGFSIRKFALSTASIAVARPDTRAASLVARVFGDSRRSADGRLANFTRPESTTTHAAMLAISHAREGFPRASRIALATAPDIPRDCISPLVPSASHFEL